MIRGTAYRRGLIERAIPCVYTPSLSRKQCREVVKQCTDTKQFELHVKFTCCIGQTTRRVQMDEKKRKDGRSYSHY